MLLLSDVSNLLGTNHLIFTGGGGGGGCTKKCQKPVCRRQKLGKKLFANSLSKKFVCIVTLNNLRISKYQPVAKMPLAVDTRDKILSMAFCYWPQFVINDLL